MDAPQLDRIEKRLEHIDDRLRKVETRLAMYIGAAGAVGSGLAVLLEAILR